ncbi:Ig-like domain-containing protein [Nocardioides okcheonensis]|uniref:Ig-like domain-containing protein n=1 Tax=Nocardioides okcheonensis TaxID=2894081 RepID=UPI001E59E3F6|nr:Ig-like domain-containing protein [Nocardioides okcheonensis]UFN44868.1 Ig-like domain-containing protein [Nocardioides okcheonensis]
MHVRTPRRSAAAGVVLALLAPTALVTLAQPATAQPLPATYGATAHGDIVDLDAQVLGTGSLAGAVIGHSRSTVASDSGGGTSDATSANLDAQLLFGGVPIAPDRETATAPPSSDPPERTLVDLPLDLLAGVDAVTGDVQAAWNGAASCVPATGGERVLSDARTALAGVTLLDLPAPVGTLAEVQASQTRSRTALVDRGTTSDVVARTTTTVGDIDLLGGQVTVDVTNPVVLQARSDGTTGSAGFVSPPTITATVGGTPVDIPLNGQPQRIDLPGALEPLVDLSITAFTPTDQSSGATGRGTLDALLRIDLDVLGLLPGAPAAADVSLAVAPMSVEASAPAGGVECGADDTTAPEAPVITAPADGSVTDDATPEFSGTAEPGSTVVVRDPAGTEVCTDQADGDGAWSCTPTTALPDGEATYTATATDAAGNTSAPDSTTVTIDTTAPQVTVFTPADGSATTDLTPEVTGVGEPGATITVREGGTTVCTTTADGDGAWSCSATTPLVLGQHTFTATARDAAGNTAEASTTFTVVFVGGGDTTAPDAPVITAPADGASTQDTTPRIGGTGETGATVIVREGSTVLCTAVVTGDGTWACTPARELAVGQHAVTATQADASGNTSPADTSTFTVVRAPAPPPGDSDGDGVDDQQEGTLGTNPNDADSDDDGLGDGAEVNTHGTSPLDPDSDNDGLTDGAEVNTHGTDPRDADSDDDGLKDGREVRGMKIRERFEVCGRKARSSITVRTDPLRADTDRDGISDGREVKGYRIKQRVTQRVSLRGKGKTLRTVVIGKTRTNPRKLDTDRDGLKDKVEKTGKANKRHGKAKTDPSKCDTDRGGVSDGREVRAGSDPSDIRSGPRGAMSRRDRSDRLPGSMG